MCKTGWERNIEKFELIEGYKYLNKIKIASILIFLNLGLKLNLMSCILVDTNSRIHLTSVISQF